MAKTSVYLPDALAEKVREAGIPVSAVCQAALEQALVQAGEPIDHLSEALRHLQAHKAEQEAT